MDNLRTKALETIILEDGEKYVKVNARIKHLAENFFYDISTEEEFIPELNSWKVKATLVIYDNDLTMSYNGTSIKEIEGKDGISALENAETSAVGRACAMAGIGVNNGIASADEINSKNVFLSADEKFENTKTKAKTAEADVMAQIEKKISKK